MINLQVFADGEGDGSGAGDGNEDGAGAGSGDSGNEMSFDDFWGRQRIARSSTAECRKR